MLGGGMRQAGIIAGPGIESLKNIDRLSRDHDNAQRLAEELDDIEGLSTNDPDTNIVLVDIKDTNMIVEEFLERCREKDILGVEFSNSVVRFCTHKDVTGEDITATIERIDDI
ncbi:MAG: beta-eliminating lyase-related protein, partial [Halobacteriaceae archaeon]